MSDENIPQMRETIERLSKEKAGLQTEVSDLGKEVRKRDARDAFRSEGFNPLNGDLYAMANPEGDITAEAVVAFADTQGLPLLGDTQEDSGDAGDSTTETGDGNQDLAGMSGGGSGAGDGGAGGAVTEALTRDAWRDLYNEDPEAAKAAIASGRVEISKDNPFVKGTTSAPGVNPYAGVAATP